MEVYGERRGARGAITEVVVFGWRKDSNSGRPRLKRRGLLTLALCRPQLCARPEERVLIIWG